MGQLEWASSASLDRPMTNPQGADNGPMLADVAEPATPAGGTALARTALTAARTRLITTRCPQARWLADVRETGPLR